MVRAEAILLKEDKLACKLFPVQVDHRSGLAGSSGDAVMVTFGPPNRDSEEVVDNDILGMGAKAHDTSKATTPPNKAKLIDDDILGLESESHAMGH